MSAMFFGGEDLDIYLGYVDLGKDTLNPATGTGCPFEPKAIIASKMCSNGLTNGQHTTFYLQDTLGFALNKSGVPQVAKSYFSDIAGTVRTVGAQRELVFMEYNQNVSVSGFTSDGFVLTKRLTDSAGYYDNEYMMYLALDTKDVDMWVGFIRPPANTTSDWSSTGSFQPGFQSQMVMFLTSTLESADHYTHGWDGQMNGWAWTDGVHESSFNFADMDQASDTWAASWADNAIASHTWNYLGQVAIPHKFHHMEFTASGWRVKSDYIDSVDDINGLDLWPAFALEQPHPKYDNIPIENQITAEALQFIRKVYIENLGTVFNNPKLFNEIIGRTESVDKLPIDFISSIVSIEKITVEELLGIIDFDKIHLENLGTMYQDIKVFIEVLATILGLNTAQIDTISEILDIVGSTPVERLLQIDKTDKTPIDNIGAELISSIKHLPLEVISQFADLEKVPVEHILQFVTWRSEPIDTPYGLENVPEFPVSSLQGISKTGHLLLDLMTTFVNELVKLPIEVLTFIPTLYNLSVEELLSVYQYPKTPIENQGLAIIEAFKSLPIEVIERLSEIRNLNIDFKGAFVDYHRLAIEFLASLARFDDVKVENLAGLEVIDKTLIENRGYAVITLARKIYIDYLLHLDEVESISIDNVLGIGDIVKEFPLGYLKQTKKDKPPKGDPPGQLPGDDSVTRITNPNRNCVYDQYFGEEIVAYGNYLIAGVDNERLGGDTCGAIYLFKSTEDYPFPVFIDGLYAYSGIDGDNLGTKLDIDDGWVIASNFRHDYDNNHNNYVEDAGAAFVYQIVNDVLETGDTIAAEGTNARNANDHWSTGVAINGDYLAISSSVHQYNETGGIPLSNAGSVQIFERSGNDWNLHQRIVNTGDQRIVNGYFGDYLDMCDDCLIVASPRYDGDNKGALFVFQRDISDIYQQTQMIRPTGYPSANEFGTEVKLYDRFLAVNQKYDVVGYVGGSVWIYEKINGTGLFNYIQTIISPSPEVDGWFGADIDIGLVNGLTGIVIGEPNTTSPLGDGNAYLFYWNGSVFDTGNTLGLYPNSGANTDLISYGSSVAIADNSIMIGDPDSEYDGKGLNKCYGVSPGAVWAFSNITYGAEDFDVIPIEYQARFDSGQRVLVESLAKLFGIDELPIDSLAAIFDISVSPVENLEGIFGIDKSPIGVLGSVLGSNSIPIGLFGVEAFTVIKNLPIDWTERVAVDKKTAIDMVRAIDPAQIDLLIRMLDVHTSAILVPVSWLAPETAGKALKWVLNNRSTVWILESCD
jgi:hypothetical protein